MANTHAGPRIAARGDHSKDRRCLSCSRLFYSHGPGNRICKQCTRNQARSSDSTEGQNIAFKRNKKI